MLARGDGWYYLPDFTRGNMMSKPKPKLLGSSDTREGIEGIINRYYYSTNYRVSEANEIVRQQDGYVPSNVRVVKAGFRFRFELLPTEETK